jgi:hypothetical protein
MSALTSGPGKQENRDVASPRDVGKGVPVRRTGSRVSLAALVAAGLLAGSAPAAAPTSAGCTGQFFSSHAGSPTEGVTVGGFVSLTARELGADFGQTIASARQLPREDCGL